MIIARYYSLKIAKFASDWKLKVYRSPTKT